MPEARICGIDFDNTIVDYDELLARIASERGLLRYANGSKRALRDRIRLLPDGEIEWQTCQALLYASRIHEAKLSRGVTAFLGQCRASGVRVYVISHKTEYSYYDVTRTNLRDAALEWMAANGLFESVEFGLTRSQVFFAGTRQEKVAQVAELGCTHFIDDLDETFQEESFPASAVRILYEPGRNAPPPRGVILMTTWQEISDYFFSRR
jgi:hypothetical protein